MRSVRCWGLSGLALLLLAATAYAGGGRNAAPLKPAEALVSVCFVPAQACDTQVAAAIGSATRFIRVQAYGLTAPAILNALADARARGVDVQAVLDKTDDSDRVADASHSVGARFTAEAGIPTWIDDSVAIAHNKVIIIDGHLVIGGSYNYTISAENRNAENVTFIDSPVVADFYLMNWETRRAASRPSRFAPEQPVSQAIASATAQ